MSTQDHSSVAFGIARDQQAFRLLELPAELLDLITAPDPPRLTIKSAETTSPHEAQGGKPAHAVLCTPNKTYQIRQVQTSNSVFVAQAYSHIDGAGHSVDGLNAIASCSATIELHPVTEAASEYFKKSLNTWDGEPSSSGRSKNGRTKSDVLADIPLSNGECESSWIKVCAFEHNGDCFEPTVDALVSLWKDTLEAATAEDINIGEMFLVNELWRTIENQAMGSTPEPLLNAMLRRLSPDEPIDEGWARLDEAKTVQWVGSALLQSLRTENLLTADFLDRWRNALPEKWRNSAQLEVIKDYYRLPTDTTIAWSNDSEKGKLGPKPISAAPKAGSSSRKWHEKFKGSRK